VTGVQTCALPIFLNLFREEMELDAGGTADPRRKVSFETEEYCSDGSTIRVENSVTLLRDATGRASRILGISREITERKRAEKILQEEEAKYRRIYETALEGIWGLDTSYHIVFVNPKMADILGYPAEEILGRSVADFIAPDEKSEAEQLFEHHKTGMKEQFERRYIRKDGAIIILLVSASPIFGEDGTFRGSFAMFTDITGRKQAEKALRQANKKLLLLSGITRHDILNKIAIIFGYLKIAETKGNDPAIGDYLKKIDSNVTAIRSQIEFTRVYQDLGTHEPQWLALEGIIPRLQVPSTIHLTADGQGIVVFADPLLEKVFSNLLDNSIRHGQRVSEIRVSSHRSGKDLVLVWEDNGIGVPADEKEKIFEQGFGKNTGLGMFLAREILALTGITITETGEPARGARFEILVPEEAYRAAGA
jgi:PAS domain S-box-containing protein